MQNKLKILYENFLVPCIDTVLWQLAAPFFLGTCDKSIWTNNNKDIVSSDHNILFPKIHNSSHYNI